MGCTYFASTSQPGTRRDDILARSPDRATFQLMNTNKLTKVYTIDLNQMHQSRAQKPL